MSPTDPPPPELHAEHGTVSLSLTTPTEDGRLFQSWTVCGCTADRVRAMLGQPRTETYATADQIRSTAEHATAAGWVQYRHD